MRGKKEPKFHNSILELKNKTYTLWYEMNNEIKLIQKII